MAPLLELEGVEARYGPVRALQGVSIAVGEGEVVALLGANGAGKTSTLRAVSGTVRRTGRISFAGRSLAPSPEAVARAGIAHVPEGRGTFAELSVRENLRLGAWTRRGHLRGEQQMLALARALMARPRLLMLDEPSLGLAPLVVASIFAILRRLNEEEGLAILLVEQNATLALEAASSAYVLEVGRVALVGPAADLRADESVRRSYLGY